jgi:hypothetical protein
MAMLDGQIRRFWHSRAGAGGGYDVLGSRQVLALR